MKYLIAHTNSAGTGIAQATIEAEATAEISAEAAARMKFFVLYPDRDISIIAHKEG